MDRVEEVSYLSERRTTKIHLPRVMGLKYNIKILQVILFLKNLTYKNYGSNERSMRSDRS